MAHFHEPGWQNMLEKAPHELEWCHGHRAGALTVYLAVTEHHRLIIGADDPAFRDCDLKHVAGQVFEARRRLSKLTRY